MLKWLLLITLALVQTILTTGCSTKVSVQEVLQMPMNTKIYTNGNIWYEDPEDISSLNYQKGKILPFGTEIEPIEADSKSLTFRDKETGQKYCINVDSSFMMIPAEFYYKNLLTTKTKNEIIEGIQTSVVEKISKGVIEEGMTRREVLLAYGFPVAHRTPSIKEDTWVYWTDKLSTLRVVFKGDKVVAILKFKD